MSLTVQQQSTLTQGITDAKGAATVGGTTVTRSEAAGIVGSLLRSGVSPADIRTALAAPEIDAATRTAFEQAMTSTGTAFPSNYASATQTAANRTINIPNGTFPFLTSVPDSVTPQQLAALQQQQTAAVDRAGTCLRGAETAMRAGNYAEAARLYREVGLPIGQNFDISNATPEQSAALVKLGLYRVGSDGSLNPSPGANPSASEPFRTINGMAARAELLGDMQALGGSPSNPPSEADVAAYLGAAGARHANDPAALGRCLDRVEHGLLIHYRSSDSQQDISYTGGYPTSFSNITAQTEVGGRRRADCQLEAMTWFESARMAGGTPVAIVAIDPSGPGGIGHAIAAFEIGGKLYIGSGDERVEVPPGPGSVESRIRSACDQYMRDTFHHAPGPIHVGMGSNIETASRAAYNPGGS